MEKQFFSLPLIKRIANALEMLTESAKLHTRSQLNSQENTLVITQFREVLSSNKESLIEQKKSLGKQPRLSRSKNPCTQNKQNKLRTAYLVQKEKLEDEITNITDRCKQLSNNGKIKDLVTQFHERSESMCHAKYQDDINGNKYLPTYLNVYDQFNLACEQGYVLKTDEYQHWNESVESFTEHQYSVEDTQAAFAYLAASKRSLKYPHDLSIEQVFDGLGDKEWEQQIIQDVVSNHINIKKFAALQCTRLNEYSALKINHVSCVINEALPSIKNPDSNVPCNFFLSTPMGGVYNVIVDGKTYNSGSKTDGVLLPAVLAGLEFGNYITIVVHRITLTHDIYNRVCRHLNSSSPIHAGKVWHYETKLLTVNPRVLVVCVNSLTRPDIAEFISKSHVVIVDEFTQTIDNIYSLLEGEGSEKELQKALTTFELLINQIEDQRTTFIALDADMESKSLDLIKQHTQTESKTLIFNITHPECSIPHSLRTKQAVFHRDSHNIQQVKVHLQSLIDERKKAIQNNNADARFFIAVDSKNQSTTLAEYCTQQGLSVCLINSDTTQANDDLGAFGLMNHSCSPECFDVIIFSPSITSGVSWTTPAFNKGIVIANKTISSGNLKQMLFRFRSTKRVDVFAQMTPARDYVPEDGNKKTHLLLLANHVKFGQLYFSLREHRKDIEYQSTQNQRCYLAYQLGEEGWGVSTIDPAYLSDSSLSTYSAINATARTDAIMKSSKLTIQEYKHIVSSTNKTKTSQEIYAAELFRSTLYGSVSDNDADVKQWVSGSAEKPAARIQMHLLSQYNTLATTTLDMFLSGCGFPDWKSLLIEGKEISVANSESQRVFLSMLNNPHSLTALHALEVFDNGKESNRKRWIRTQGTPIKEGAAVISYLKVSFSTTGCLFEDLRLRLQLPYQAFQLFDGNVLVVNTKPKINSYAAAILRKLLAICGIKAEANNSSTLIGGEWFASLVNTAKRRTISQQIQANIINSESKVRSVQIKDATEASRFNLKIYSHGELRLTATPHLISKLINQNKLTQTGWLISFASYWGRENELPQLNMGYPLNDASNDSSELHEVHLTSNNQFLKYETSKHYPLSISDNVSLLMPVLLSDQNIVDSMLKDLNMVVNTSN